jgi:hypothetical protein
MGRLFFVSARSLAGFISGMDNGCPAIIVDRQVPRPAIGGIVRQLHFRRDWKVSAIREAPRCLSRPDGMGGELH